jgi:murein L,D-transpeptidase YafK
MRRIKSMHIPAVLLAIGALTFLGMKITEARNHPDREDRVAAARPRAEPPLRAAFAKAGVAYPATVLHLRAYKHEGELELWAADKPGILTHITTFPILTPSGVPGPKRKEGDRQVPEGFYSIDRFNPRSLYHLSLGLDYPNAADRIHGHPTTPGTDIFIHGRTATIGCLPMGDEMIERIYLASLDTRQKPITVHIFPARMSGDAWPSWRDTHTAKNPALAPFWAQLQPAYDHFIKHRTVPEITISPDGTYRTQGQ